MTSATQTVLIPASERPEAAGMVRPVTKADGTVVDLATYPAEVQDAYDTIIQAFWRATLYLARRDARLAAEAQAQKEQGA